MNTVEIGNRFEDVCYFVISNAINSNNLGVIPNQCKIYKKKGYYSHLRKSEIEFDLAFEVFPPNAINYTLLYLIECKSYSTKNVPVDDIEEFYTKIQQVIGFSVNVKGVFISRTSFQSGCYTFAQSTGIMLIEATNDITYNIVLHKTSRFKAIKDENSFNNIQFDLNKLKRQIDKYLLSSFINYVKNSNHIPKVDNITKYSKESIEEITSQLLLNIEKNLSNYSNIVTMEKIIIFLHEIFGLRIIVTKIDEFDENGRAILSKCSFVEKTIYVNREIATSNRYSFTLAHEIGHYILHNKIQIDQYSYDSYSDSQYNFSLDRFLLENDRNWIEWQANQFASFLLMPKNTFLYHFAKAQSELNLKPGSQLYLDEQRWNVDSFHNLTRKLSLIFHTTKTSVIFRMNSLNLLKQASTTKPLNLILSEIIQKIQEQN